MIENDKFNTTTKKTPKIYESATVHDRNEKEIESSHSAMPDGTIAGSVRHIDRSLTDQNTIITHTLVNEVTGFIARMDKKFTEVNLELETIKQ